MNKNNENLIFGRNPVKEALKAMDLEENIRAEVLKPLDFVELYKLLLL